VDRLCGWRLTGGLEPVGAFVKFAKRDNYLRHVCPSVRIEQFVSHWTDFHEIRYLSIFRKKEKKKVKLHSNLTRITGTLHEDQCAFLIISCSVLLRMRNVSDKSCTENKNTHFVVGNFFSPKIVPFMRLCGKIL
jgi:hypothetical protein